MAALCDRPPEAWISRRRGEGPIGATRTGTTALAVDLGWDEDPLKGGQTMKILVAYDGTPAAHTALTTTISLAQAFEASVGVISVVPFHAGKVPVDPWDDRPVHDAQLRTARKLLVEAGIEPTLLEPAGDPAVAIEQAAEQGGYDTIVIGSRGLGALGRFFSGSVSEHVATHAKATVIVAR
jgi:nucleotide-binding universal stress UspA family protein